MATAGSQAADGPRQASSRSIGTEPRKPTALPCVRGSTSPLGADDDERCAVPPRMQIDPGHGDHELFASYGALGVIGWTLLLLLLAAALTTLVLWRSGRLPQVGSSRGRSADDQARQILAERFARGDLSSEEFLERCATLNWTPGIDRPKSGRKRS